MKFAIILSMLLTGCSIVIVPEHSGASNNGSSDLIYTTNRYGEPMPHKGMYKVSGNMIYQTDSIGNIQYHKPALKISK